MESDAGQNNKAYVSDDAAIETSSVVNEVENTDCGTKTKKSEKKQKMLGLLYELDDKPQWHLCVFLGIQHCLLAIGGLIGIPLLLGPMMCMPENDLGFLAKAMVLNSLFFICGILTFLQTTFGTRLPILQGASYSFLPSSLAILALPHNQCPSGPVNYNATNETLLYNDTDGMLVDGTELWQRRMREIQGAITVASIAQVILGLTGCIGFLMKFIGPLTIATSISLIALSLFEAASYNASGQWGVAFFTIVVLIVLSQYLRNVKLPFPVYTRSKGCHISKTNFFKMFPVLITIALGWLLCVVLTETNALPNDPSAPGYRGRTDVRISVLQSSPWFRFPYPGQWGLPVVTTADVVGMLAGVVAGIIESIGDYYACARLSGAPPPPKHAVNRGISIEGFGCILCGVVGTATGSTSYSENVGAIGITRVASRRVLQIAGIVFFLFGMFGKFGAVLVLIPDPVMGGMFCVIFGMILAVGLSNLQHVDLNSSRNLFVLGFSVFMGMMIPIWMKGNTNAINTGVKELDQIFVVLLETSIFIGGVLAAFLDNTIPGTPEERGMYSSNSEMIGKDKSPEDLEKYEKRLAKCYNLPFSTDWRFSRYIPIFPEFGKTRKRKNKDIDLTV